ncbi:hypothetical protein HAX54_052847 [Datura stramonium]|uniref:Uncharacterized protein n=1 Tax=Datura stramonium TaxID=4076 RepID=A0ABS8SZI0_DATST|nr:hypothetical protein [Datura stramonium]
MDLRSGATTPAAVHDGHVQPIRCSAVSTSWEKAVYKLKLDQTEYFKQQHSDPNGLNDASFSQRSLSEQAEQLAMERHRLALQRCPADVFQWKGHSVGVNQCRMKMGKVLTGSPLIDFDFDESKVVGLVGTRICIWNHPEAVIGCEDGMFFVFDSIQQKVFPNNKDGQRACYLLSFTDDQLLVSGSSWQFFHYRIFLPSASLFCWGQPTLQVSEIYLTDPEYTDNLLNEASTSLVIDLSFLNL